MEGGCALFGYTLCICIVYMWSIGKFFRNNGERPSLTVRESCYGPTYRDGYRRLWIQSIRG